MQNVLQYLQAELLKEHRVHRELGLRQLEDALKPKQEPVRAEPAPPAEEEPDLAAA